MNLETHEYPSCRKCGLPYTGTYKRANGLCDRCDHEEAETVNYKCRVCGKMIGQVWGQRTGLCPSCYRFKL